MITAVPGYFMVSDCDGKVYIDTDNPIIAWHVSESWEEGEDGFPEGLVSSTSPVSLLDGNLYGREYVFVSPVFQVVDESGNTWEMEAYRRWIGSRNTRNERAGRSPV